MWILRVSDGRRLEFEDFDPARHYLLNELWWAAEDCPDTATSFMDAWVAVLGWRSAYTWEAPFELTVLGTEYQLMRRKMEVQLGLET